MSHHSDNPPTRSPDVGKSRTPTETDIEAQYRPLAIPTYCFTRSVTFTRARLGSGWLVDLYRTGFPPAGFQFKVSVHYIVNKHPP